MEDSTKKIHIDLLDLWDLYLQAASDLTKSKIDLKKQKPRLKRITADAFYLSIRNEYFCQEAEEVLGMFH